LFSFLKYNIVSLLATALDFTVFVILTKLLGTWYVLAAAISAVSGGMLAFWFNRNWVFDSKTGHIKNQAMKYIIVWISSILLNTIGIFLMVENTNLKPLYAKIIVAILVGVFFNFLMNKYYVFRQPNK